MRLSLTQRPPRRQLSLWLPGTMKPVRVGVYRRQYTFGVRFAYWNGERWSVYGRTAREAFDNVDVPSSLNARHHRWQGLSTPAIH